MSSNPDRVFYVAFIIPILLFCASPNDLCGMWASALSFMSSCHCPPPLNPLRVHLATAQVEANTEKAELLMAISLIGGSLQNVPEFETVCLSSESGLMHGDEPNLSSTFSFASFSFLSTAPIFTTPICAHSMDSQDTTQ